MRINPLKLDDRPLHPHRRSSVMVGERMMRCQRSHGRDGENQCATASLRCGILTSMIVQDRSLATLPACYLFGDGR